MRLPCAVAVSVAGILRDALAAVVPGVRSDDPSAVMSVYRVADLFCGAGGFSAGAAEAIRRRGDTMELTAVNHWATAVATHSENHPEGRHITADLTGADPYALIPGRRLDLLLASPECRYYSRSNGGRVTQDQGRMNPWIIHDWLTKLDVGTVIVENVSEFLGWGPLAADGKPDQEKRGRYFQAWFHTFGNLGYRAELKILTAAFYGDATSRTRLFVVARQGDAPIAWPEPTHDDPRGQVGMFPRRPRWRTAADIIDWDCQGQSVLDGNRRRRLQPKTMCRIAKGMAKHNPQLAPHYLPLLAGEVPAEALPAGVTPRPYLVEYYGKSSTRSVGLPLSTVTTVKKHGLAVPVVADGRADLRYRMLNNRELAAAMGFQDYRFTGTDREVTKQIGNAVPVGLAAALIGAVLEG